MSDYGFKTDDKTGKIALNAKNPIFGFDMGHKPRAFKTFRFRDTKQSTTNVGTTPEPNPPFVPDNWSTAENNQRGQVRELIMKVKHGYNFRPVGYATITGNLKINTNVKITQTQRAGNFGGNYSRQWVYQTRSYTLTPSQYNKAFVAIASDVFNGAWAILQQSDFTGTLWNYGIENYFTGVYNFESSYGIPGEENMPISVEIDDEYIYFYRKWAWYNEVRRAMWRESNWAVHQDIQERVQISNDFAGSTYDVTVYLCPFPIKEIL